MIDKFTRIIKSDTFNKVCLLILIIISVLIFFGNLDRNQFELWDESTNVGVVLHTINSDNPYILTYNNQPFLEKPPLWYYLTMAIVKVFGFGYYQVRVISATAGFLTTILIYKIVSEKRNGVNGLIAGFTFLSIGQIVQTNISGYFSTHTLRSADLDALQILFIVLAFASLLKAGDGIKYIKYSVVAICLGYLSKGTLILLPAVFMAVYVYKNRTKFNLKKIDLIHFLIIIIVILIPWHLLMVYKYGSSFINEYFIYHIFQRSFVALEGHSEEIFFYFQIFSNKLVNITWPFFITALFIQRQKASKDLLFVFSISFIGFVFALLTIIPTKLAWYILPVYPFVAILIGSSTMFIKYLDRRIQAVVISALLILICVGIFNNLMYIFPNFI